MTALCNRVVRGRRFGDPDGLEIVDAPLPTAGRGEVRVRVLASSLNYTEVLIRRPLYPQTMHLRLPFVIGYDVVGEIDQIGDGVRDFQIGDRVADMTVVGSNADYRTLPADDVVRVPAGVDAAEAATLILSWTTAYQLLHRAARVRRGQRVLVHGAASAIRPHVAELITFDQVAEAHRRHEGGGLEGKLVLCPDLELQRERVPRQRGPDTLL